MEVDYIIVGLGIAGVAYSKQLLDGGNSFIAISDGAAKATQASGGVFNPIVLRRFTAPEDSLEFIDYAYQTYQEIQSLIGDSWSYPTQKVHRVFASLEEQNNWFIASDKPHLKEFIYPKVVSNDNPLIFAEYGLGKVTKSFKIDPVGLISAYQEYLLSQNKMLLESFEHDKLEEVEGNYPFLYKNIKAKRILFAEGADGINNPFINTPILRPNKGEYLIVKSADLKLDYMLKAGVYIIPLGEDLYKVGATYSPNDASDNPTEKARIEIETKLQKMISCDYEVVNQITGVRPVTKDHQPVLGKIKEGMYVFNGLGTRGFTRGPLYSKFLYEAIENKSPIPAIMDFKRFSS